MYYICKHFAYDFLYLDICKLIISNIDDKNPKAEDGTTPLHAAKKEGHESVVRLLKSFDNSLHPAKRKRRYD